MILVHNDFHQTHGLFPLFDGLAVEDLSKAYEVHTNGNYSNGIYTNGFSEAKGISGELRLNNRERVSVTNSPH
jgi:methylenetetrahydrofolate reductase (NADPH)